MNNERFKSTIGFTDLLFNILVGFAFLFIVAFLLIKPEAKKKDFDRRAEYIVIMEWDSGAKDDIDLYVEDPLGGLASFRHPAVNFTHLDKDDLGSRNDTTVLADGSTTTIQINREVMTIRGIIPGEWVVNAHYYSAHNYNKVNSADYFITVKIELHKVNPYKILWVGEKKYMKKGQEETYLRFRLSSEGELLSPFTFEEKKFISPSGVSSSGPPSSTGSNPDPTNIMGSGLSVFSQMGNYEPKIVGPMVGIDDIEEEVDEQQWIENAKQSSGEGP